MSDKKILLIITDGISNSEYKCLTQSANIFKNWKLVSIRYSDLYDLSISLDIKSSFSDVITSSFSEFNANRNIYKGPYDYIFNNEHLNFQFKGVQSEINSSQYLAEVFSKFLEILSPQAIIFGHDAFTRERCLVNKAKQLQIITFGLLHSGLGFKCAFRGIVGDVDYVLVWNSIDKRFINEYGISENRIVIIGSLSYEILKSKYAKKSISFNLQIRPRNKILVITAAINSGFSGPIASQTDHLKIVRDLISYISKRQDLDFVIKTHPSFDHYELYRQLRNYNLSNYFFDEKIDLKNAIKESKACVLLNYFTTATLDVLINNIPVVFLQNAVYPLEDWCTNDINSVIPKVDNILDLELIIDKLIENKLFKNQTLKNSQLLINSIIYEQNSSPVLILNNFLNSLSFDQSYIKPKNTFTNTPTNLFVLGAKNFQLNYAFDYKFFRMNTLINNFRYETLFKFYIRGSNSGKSLETPKSLIYLFCILILNIDLLLKVRNIKNRELLKYFYRQIVRL